VQIGRGTSSHLKKTISVLREAPVDLTVRTVDIRELHEPPT
jgi:hypothetical protein